MVEIGVPFSDPMADGATIQRASFAALQDGFTLTWLLQELEQMQPRPQAPLLLMSYLNPLLAFGLERLPEAAARAGVAGFIIPDLPYEESADMRAALDRVGIALVQMVTPVTPHARLAMLCKASQGFVYAVTMTGTTGKSVAVPREVLDYMDRVRAVSPVPVCAGLRHSPRASRSHACKAMSMAWSSARHWSRCSSAARIRRSSCAHCAGPDDRLVTRNASRSATNVRRYASNGRVTAVSIRSITSERICCSGFCSHVNTGGERRSMDQRPVFSTWSRYSRLRSIASMYGLRPLYSASRYRYAPLNSPSSRVRIVSAKNCGVCRSMSSPEPYMHLERAVVRARDRDTAEHEFGVQPVAAFLEITAIRHLREHVGGAEQVPDLAIARIVEADLVERHFVTGEMHDLRRHRHPVREPDRRQVTREELRAAADVRAA